VEDVMTLIYSNLINGNRDQSPTKGCRAIDERMNNKREYVHLLFFHSEPKKNFVRQFVVVFVEKWRVTAI
jgi:hypothetical protein